MYRREKQSLLVAWTRVLSLRKWFIPILSPKYCIDHHFILHPLDYWTETNGSLHTALCDVFKGLLVAKGLTCISRTRRHTVAMLSLSSVPRLSSLSFRSPWTEPSPPELATASLINSDLPWLPVSGSHCLSRTAVCPVGGSSSSTAQLLSGLPQPPAPAPSPSRGSPESAPVSLDIGVSRELERNILFLITASSITFLLLLLHHMRGKKVTETYWKKYVLTP